MRYPLVRYCILDFSVCRVSQKLLKLISKLCPLDCNRQEEKEGKQTTKQRYKQKRRILGLESSQGWAQLGGGDIPGLRPAGSQGLSLT